MAIELSQHHLIDEQAALDLVDAIVSAVDLNRSPEVDRIRAALEALGLDGIFQAELRLSGVPSVCNGECWTEAVS